MKSTDRFSSAVMVIILTALILTGCSHAAFFRPPGKNIGSCEGRIQLTDGGRTKFRVDVFSRDDGDISLWFSLPNRGVRYRRIEDIDFGDDGITVETSSPGRVYQGVIVGDKLKFKGALDGLSGSFMLNFDN